MGLDIKYILANPERIKEVIRNKKVSGITPEDVDRLIKLYNKLSKIKQQVQELRTRRNQIAEELKKKRTDVLIEEGRRLKRKIATLEETMRSLESEFDQVYRFIPGIYSDDTPIGESEADNVVVRRWGEKPKFDFEPKTHDQLLKQLGVLDTERGVKVAGFRGYFLLGDLALLHWAVLTYAFSKLVQKGFIPVIPPTVAKRFVLYGAGQFPWGEEDTYKIANPHGKEDYFLIGTAEQPLMALFANETLRYNRLPIRLVGFSPAYRREVGAHQKDLKGIIRLHEFWKVEQVVIGPPDKEWAVEEHESITKNAEEIMQELGIHYRVMAMCTADMGNPHYRKYDIEAWMPGQGRYRETHSSSIMSDFQCRRNNIRVEMPDGTKRYAWSLNNTAIASPRILAVIVENYQNEDGSITIPEVLRPYMFGREKIEPLKW